MPRPPGRAGPLGKAQKRGKACTRGADSRHPVAVARFLAMERKDLRQLLASFHSRGVEFPVVGGHAVAFHGRPRLTEDLDLYVLPDAANGERIEDDASLESIGR